MLEGNIRTDAEEPQFSAFLSAMRFAVLHARYLIRYELGDPQERDQHIHDLMDAVENVPLYLARHEDFWEWKGENKKDTMLSYLQMYDDKWANTEHGISLVKHYETSLEKFS